MNIRKWKLFKLLQTLERRDYTLGVPGYSTAPFLADFLLHSLVYWGTMIINPNRYHWDFTLPIDAMIPVDGRWGIVYFGSFLFWAVSCVLVAREDRRTACRLLGGDMLGKAICFLFFVVIPTGNVRPDAGGPGFGNFMLRVLRFVDEPVNLFPSMHCYMSWYCARWLGRRRNRTRAGVILGYVIALLIFYSTLATRQHFVVDVPGGIAVAELVLFLEKKWNPGRLYEKLDDWIVRE